MTAEEVGSGGVGLQWDLEATGAGGGGGRCRHPGARALAQLLKIKVKFM